MLSFLSIKFFFFFFFLLEKLKICIKLIIMHELVVAVLILDVPLCTKKMS